MTLKKKIILYCLDLFSPRAQKRRGKGRGSLSTSVLALVEVQPEPHMAV
jgi:hypothetical protein